ncbi:MAG: hypothetical protein H0T53_06325 [Herpetosiphonaceae bacterium]|nr:hypothetical protein [Herpetosiphonaceae bacterium]
MTTYIQRSGDHAWVVDSAAAGQAAAWAGRNPAALEAELAGMASYFPHWQLVGASGGQIVRCPSCRAWAVPSAGAIRCLACQEELAASGLAWVGEIPVLARPEARVAKRQLALREAGFGEVTVEGLTYLLVPLSVRYPSEWPNLEPTVRYAGRWLDALGLPRSSVAHHLIEDGRACIFGWGQWSALTVADVLQQRMVNHIASLFKVVAGQTPRDAFIGRIH